MKKTIIICVLFLLCHFSFSQNKLSSTQSALLQEKVQGYLDKPQPEFAAALPLLLKLHDDKPKDLGFNYALGFCYINLDDERALPYFELCLQSPENFADELIYYSARAFQLKHKFEEAIKLYEQFRRTIKKPEKHLKQIDEVYHQEKMCENGIELMNNQRELKIFSLGDGINSKYPEYGPIFNADQNMMMFTSCRPDTKGGHIDNFDGRFFEDIYISYKNDKGEWGEANNIGNDINTEGNDAIVSMSPDGQTIFLYKYSHGQGDLYSSKLEGESWGEPLKMPEPINSSNWEPSMSISPDENTIYFASNRDGGFGGTDIYRVKKLPNGKWAEPMNLGATINSEYDEDSPFILADGQTLYFSSNGNKSMGGHDIFVSHLDLESKKWSEVENLGYPINSAHDDLYFSISADGETMYFSSFHSEGMGEKDIYYAKMENDEVSVMLVKGRVVDANTLEPIKAHIEILNIKTGEIIGVYNSNESSGDYTIIFQEGMEYKIEVSSDNYEPFIDSLKVPTLQSFNIKTRDFKLLRKK